jgi:hypothetical protein
MNVRALNHINGRLSLRPPQAESLSRLVRALEAAPELLGHERDVSAILSTLKAEFPTLQDFEREFPSLCFALATRVPARKRSSTRYIRPPRLRVSSMLRILSIEGCSGKCWVR